MSLRDVLPTDDRDHVVWCFGRIPESYDDTRERVDAVAAVSAAKNSLWGDRAASKGCSGIELLLQGALASWAVKVLVQAPLLVTVSSKLVLVSLDGPKSHLWVQFFEDSHAAECSMPVLGGV